MAPTYYRNITTVQNIEPGYLWQKTQQGFVLVDDDQYVFETDPTYFQPAPTQ